MRKGMMNQGVIRLDDGSFCAVSLGSDFCAEHEWGIDKICEMFGIQKDISIKGIERRRIHNKDQHILYIEGRRYVLLMTTDHIYSDHATLNSKNLDNHVEKMDIYPFDYESLCVDKQYTDNSSGQMLKSPRIDPDWEITGAWDEESFGILADKEKIGNEIRELRDAFEQNDVAIWVGGSSNPFDRGGLIITIVSKTPDEYKEKMRQSDQDTEDLQKASDATGIRQKIDTINNKYREEQKAQGNGFVFDTPCGYHALSPRWYNGETLPRDNEGVCLETKYPVVYWLNPQDQKNNNWGWFTVEDLEEWTEGRGVVKKESNVSSK